MLSSSWRRARSLCHRPRSGTRPQLQTILLRRHLLPRRPKFPTRSHAASLQPRIPHATVCRDAVPPLARAVCQRPLAACVRVQHHQSRMRGLLRRLARLAGAAVAATRVGPQDERRASALQGAHRLAYLCVPPACRAASAVARGAVRQATRGGRHSSLYPTAPPRSTTVTPQPRGPHTPPCATSISPPPLPTCHRGTSASRHELRPCVSLWAGWCPCQQAVYIVWGPPLGRVRSEAGDERVRMCGTAEGRWGCEQLKRT